ncbi:hypothetical protein [Ferruginivarius sediminum]|uniref:hypothetical protein n=1 Tax=Ferruginivarius sediminum TaxID=2661937 RepID=UPI0011C06EC7|nr:hypothetical protein [Ferruginivarius sediminum]
MGDKSFDVIAEEYVEYIRGYSEEFFKIMTQVNPDVKSKSRANTISQYAWEKLYRFSSRLRENDHANGRRFLTDSCGTLYFYNSQQKKYASIRDICDKIQHQNLQGDFDLSNGKHELILTGYNQKGDKWELRFDVKEFLDKSIMAARAIYSNSNNSLF